MLAFAWESDKTFVFVSCKHRPVQEAGEPRAKRFSTTLDRSRLSVAVGKVGRMRTKKTVALLTRTSSVISIIEISEESWEEKARLQGVRLKQSYE